MAYRKEAWKRGNRHPLWSKQTFKEDVESGGGETIVAICRKWSTDPEKIQGLKNDVIVWRREDPELDALCREKFGEPGGAPRPSLELKDPDWRQRYVERYLATRSRVEAATATPYTWEAIRKKLEPAKSEYDPVFVDMLAAAESRLLDRAETIIHAALEDPDESSRNKAWVALQLLKVRDRHRFGDNIAVSVSGTIAHTLDRGKVLAQLADSQQAFLEKQKAPLQIESGAQEAEIVDAEIVEVEAE